MSYWNAYALQGNPLKNLLLLRNDLLAAEQFHFFTEPWAPLVVRIRGDEEELSKTLDYLKIEWKLDGYPEGGEVEAFGDQWETVARLLHEGCILSLKLLDKVLYYCSGAQIFLHCLMNSFGYGYKEEAEFYKQMRARSLFLAEEYDQGRMKRDYEGGTASSVTIRGTWTEPG